MSTKPYRLSENPKGIKEEFIMKTITDEAILMTYDEICNNEDECRPLYLISQEIADDLGMDFFSVTGLIVAERFIR